LEKIEIVEDVKDYVFLSLPSSLFTNKTWDSSNSREKFGDISNLCSTTVQPDSNMYKTNLL
jgi:hypothetical protein